MKLLISIGVLAGGTLGGWLGSTLDHGNGLGAWSILLSGVGSLAGIWVAYQINKNFLG